MTVVAPLKPKPPRRQEPEALIEEARRRARRRRLISAGAAILALAVGGGLYGIVELTTGAPAGQALPPGFSVVKARGPVSHVVVELRGPPPHGPLMVDVATGRGHPAKLSREIWWDPMGELDRVVAKIDGRVAFDGGGRACSSTRALSGKRVCAPPPPFDLDRRYHWPLDPSEVSEVGRGSFRGREVIWAELHGRRPPSHGIVERVALDARTHRLVVARVLQRGRLLLEQVIRWKRDLSPAIVSFAVPTGPPRTGFLPQPTSSIRFAASGLPAARRALVERPLWLGRRSLGYRFRSARVGTDAERAGDGRSLRPAKFVQFNYGTVTLQEFSPKGPFWYEQGPRPGWMAYDGRAVLTRNGLLVIISPNPHYRLDGKRATAPKINRNEALALARALRPLPD